LHLEFVHLWSRLGGRFGFVSVPSEDDNNNDKDQHHNDDDDDDSNDSRVGSITTAGRAVHSDRSTSG